MKGAKKVYEVFMKKTDTSYYVYIPLWDIHTQGEDLVDSIEMARDAIGIMGIDYEDEGLEFPTEPKELPDIDFDVKTLVDVDFKKYRQQLKNVSVKKNCTIPAWLNEEAIEKGINFSRVLQDGLIKELEKEPVM